LFIVHKDNVEKFERVHSLDDLKNLVAAQGRNWPDVAVFEHAGLPVETEEYPTLFKLIELKRVDYFPRGANEPFLEVERFQAEYPSLTIDNHVLLVYPYALYFFVSKENTALHDAIEKGLQQAHAEGSFLAFFRSHPATKKMLENAQLGGRLRIDIENPTMSAETLAVPGEFWYNESWQ
jgi:hypothetical protein